MIRYTLACLVQIVNTGKKGLVYVTRPFFLYLELRLAVIEYEI